MDKEALFSKMQLAFMMIMIGIAMAILADFEFTSQTITQEVDSKNYRLENRQSTGRNYYYAAHIQAGDYRIPVSEDFADNTEKGHQLTFNKSLLFNEVNRVTNVATGASEKFSFRWMTGCVIPLFGIVVLVLGIKRREKLNTLVFVTEVVLIINFVFLLN
jgi:hypothetical protein